MFFGRFGDSGLNPYIECMMTGRTCLYTLRPPPITVWYYGDFLVYISLQSDIISVCMSNPVTNKTTAYSCVIRKMHTVFTFQSFILKVA